ncbi:MAG TPA: FtsX-like permease family protein [archaeon]|nr:FtsX-like permease family protein [archaeon]
MIKLAFLNLFRRKTRTLLCALGIAIGVAAIIVLVSLVDGFTEEFNAVVGSFKGLSVYEKNTQDAVFSKIDESYVGRIESLPGVKAAIGEIWYVPQKIDTEAVGLTAFAAPTVYGLDISKYYSTNASGWVGAVEKGSALSSSELGQVLIGRKIEKDFKKFVGSPIEIDGKRFKVKGILKSESDLTSSIIVMNLDDARDISPLESGQISSLTVTLNDFSKDATVAKLIELQFGDDLQVFTQADLSEQFGSIVGNLRLLAIAVAIISSIVAGIGIANTMLMSVLERFREIGALKAVGWTRGNIMKMILYESIFLGLFGGLLGILLGFGVDFILLLVGISSHISIGLLLSSFLFAMFLGIVSGIYPAYRASKLDPVEALQG